LHFCNSWNATGRLVLAGYCSKQPIYMYASGH